MYIITVSSVQHVNSTRAINLYTPLTKINIKTEQKFERVGDSLTFK